MKIAVTVNLGNYENIRIESGEYDDLDECKIEVYRALVGFREPKVDDFARKMFKKE